MEQPASKSIFENVIGPLGLNFPFVSLKEAKRYRDSHIYMMDVSSFELPSGQGTKFVVKFYGCFLDKDLKAGKEDIELIKEKLLNIRGIEGDGGGWVNPVMIQEPTNLKFKRTELYTTVTMEFEITKT